MSRITSFVSVICGVEGITDCKTKGSRITVVPFVECHLRTIGYHRISGSLEQICSAQLKEPVAYVLDHSYIDLPRRFQVNDIHIAGCVSDDISIDRPSLTKIYTIEVIDSTFASE